VDRKSFPSDYKLKFKWNFYNIYLSNRKRSLKLGLLLAV